MGVAGVQRLLNVWDTILVNAILAVVVLIGSAVYPLEYTLHVLGRDGVDGRCLVVNVDAELVAPALGKLVRGPGEHDAVGIAPRFCIVNGHLARGVHLISILRPCG